MKYKTADAIKAGLDFMKMEPMVDVEWVRTIPIQDGMKILDVGCFKGRDLRRIWAYYPNCKLTGVDRYQPAINYCREEHTDIGANWVVADGSSLPFGDKEFDIVFENGMLVEQDDPGPVKAEMDRVGKAVYYS